MCAGGVGMMRDGVKVCCGRCRCGGIWSMVEQSVWDEVDSGGVCMGVVGVWM